VPTTASQDALDQLELAFEQGDLKVIRKEVTALEKAHPSDVRLAVARARLTAAQGDVAGAMGSLEKLVDDDDHGALAKAYLGALLVAQRNYVEGRAMLEEALEAGVDVPALRHSLGVALAAAGLFEEGLQHLAAAAEKMPGSAPTFFYMGVCFGELGQWDRAAGALFNCIRVDPHYEEGFEALGRVEVERGNPAQARVLAEEGLKHNPGSRILLRFKATVLSDLGDAEGALEALHRIPSGNRTAEDLTNTALMAAGSGDYARALKNAEAAVKAAPNSPHAHYALGLALEGQKPPRQAAVLAAYQASVDLGDPSGEAGTRLGFLQLEDEDPAVRKQAITSLEGAVERSGESPGAVLNLALAYAKDGQKAQAKAMCGVVLADPRAAASEQEQATRLSKVLG
jgi:tetratricopeptide (TPR) repeat protein